MTDSDEEISISQNSKNHTGMRKLRLRNQVRIKLFHIILQLTLHSDAKLCVLYVEQLCVFDSMTRLSAWQIS